MNLCLNCENWFEAKHGLKIHERSCKGSLPKLSDSDKFIFESELSLNSDGE